MRGLSSPKNAPSVEYPFFPLGLVLLSSALTWAVLFTAIPPADQNFPLNDDWAYGRGVFLFTRGQGIHYGGWGSMPQLGQWLWAAPFVWLLGPSFFALRLSTVLLSWLGLWAFFDLLRGQGWSGRAAGLAAAVLAFNPLFFLLQGTFLTDVPALSFALMALAFYVRGLQSGRGRFLLGACAVAVLGAITRQNTLAVPATALLPLWRESDQRRRPLAWLAVLLPLAVGLATHFWFMQRNDIIVIRPIVQPPPGIVLLPFLTFHLCGLAVLPLLLLSPEVGRRKSFLWFLAFMTLFALYWKWNARYLYYGALFPYCDGFLNPWGAGAAGSAAGEQPLLMGEDLRLFLTVLGCVAGAAFLARLVEELRPGRPGPLVLLAFLQAPFLLVAPEIWDRYLLLILPGALSVVRVREPVSLSRRSTAVAAVVLLALVSVGLMHDWLAWNAARWQLGRHALTQGIAPHEIEGGFEWNGWFAPPPPQRRDWKEMMSQLRQQTRATNAPGFKLHHTHWFPSVTGRYALSFSRLPHTQVLNQQPYSSWLLPGDHAFFLLTLDTPRRPKNNASQPLTHPVASSP